jgi:hypothetical protein
MMDIEKSAFKREVPPALVTEAEVDELWAEAEAELAKLEDKLRLKAGKAM